jgi:DNA transformation protein
VIWLRNLGPVSRGWLAEVGVTELADLEAVGSVEAYRRVRDRYGRRATLNLLYTLGGALLDLRWDQLPADRRRQLRAEVAPAAEPGDEPDPGQVGRYDGSPDTGDRRRRSTTRRLPSG